jgi:hypothetical protein
VPAWASADGAVRTLLLGSAISPDLGWAAGRRTQRRVRADHSSSWVMQRSRATPSTTSGTIDAGGVVDRTPERALVERRIEDQKPAVITTHRTTGEIVDTALGRRHHIGRDADQRQPHPRRWRPPCRIRGRRLLAHPDGQQSTVRRKRSEHLQNAGSGGPRHVPARRDFHADQIECPSTQWPATDVGGGGSRREQPVRVEKR